MNNNIEIRVHGFIVNHACTLKCSSLFQQHDDFRHIFGRMKKTFLFKGVRVRCTYKKWSMQKI